MTTGSWFHGESMSLPHHLNGLMSQIEEAANMDLETEDQEQEVSKTAQIVTCSFTIIFNTKGQYI